MGIRFVRMIPIWVSVCKGYRAVPTSISGSCQNQERQCAALYIVWIVRQTNTQLCLFGEAFNRLGKTVNGFVGITMFDDVPHTAVDISRTNTSAAPVLC